MMHVMKDTEMWLQYHGWLISAKLKILLKLRIRLIFICKNLSIIILKGIKMSNENNMMVNKCEEGFDNTGTIFPGDEGDFLCAQENIDPQDFKFCSSDSYDEGEITASISYYEDRSSGSNYAFYTFADGSWGYRSD